jgi:hypothetical protein
MAADLLKKSIFCNEPGIGNLYLPGKDGKTYTEKDKEENRRFFNFMKLF